MEGISRVFPPGWTDEQLDRVARVETASLAAFGDEQPRPLGGWTHRPGSEFGQWITPREYAATSDAALAEVLARIKVLSEGVTPVWSPRPDRGKARVFKARRR